MASGIDRREMWLFMREIEVQSRFALLAFDGFIRLPDLVTIFYSREENDLALHPFEPWRGSWRGTPVISGRYYGPFSHYTEADELAFFLAHAFLTHAAAISRIPDPPKPRGKKPPYTHEERKTRAAALQQALGIESPLLSGKSARAIRNSLEHTDERFEDWLKIEAGQSFDLFDMNHLPFGSATPTLPLERESFRLLGGESLSFRFQTDLQNLEAMAAELRSVLDAALAWQLGAAKESV